MKPGIGVVALIGVVVGACADRERTAPALADLVVRPSPVDFGRVALHSQRPLQAVILNAGEVPLALVDAWVDGQPADFQVRSEGPLTQTLGPGETQRVEIIFAPQTAGGSSATLSVTTDAPGGVPHQASLVGEGVAAAVTLQTSELDFGRIEVDALEDLSLQLVNDGPVPVAVAPTLAGADSAEFDGPAAAVLAPGQALSMPVHWHPAKVGVKDAALSLSPCTGCADDVVTIHAEALDQAVIAEPPQVQFGDVPIARSAEQNARLHNISTRAMTVTGMALPAGSDLSFQAAPSTFPLVLQPGEAQSFPVTYVATHMGAANATLVFDVESTHRPQTVVALNGSGGASELCVFPSNADFGDQPVGSYTVKSVTLRNCGTSTAPPLRISSAGLLLGEGPENTPFSAGGPAWPQTLAAGQQIDVPVSFAPTAPGSFAATFEVRSSGFRADTVDVPLSGSAQVHAPCELTVTPGAVDFGTVPPGSGGVLGIKVRNVGADVCAVKNIQLAQPSGPFLMPGGPLPGLLIPAGAWFSFQVAFVADAQASGSFAGAVQIEQSNRRRPVLWVPLSANAQASCLVATPPFLDFGISRPDCPPGPRRTTLINQCAAPLAIDNAWIGNGTTDGEFQILSAPVFPLTLDRAATASVQVGYSAQTLGMNLSPLFLDVPGLARPQLVPLLGESDIIRTTADTFTQQGGNALDVLFVVDNTAAMALQQPELVKAIPAFVSAAVAAELDLHVSVTTTGLTAVSSACPGGAQGGEAGRLFPADGSLPRILTQTTPSLSQALQEDVQVGLCAVTPQGLDAMLLALSPPLVNSAKDPGTPLPNDGNLGFLRSSAALAVVFVSSRDDASADDVPTYVQFLQSLKGLQQPQRVTAYAIAPTDTPCATAGGTGTRYDQVAAATGGQSLDVCASDYAPLLAAVASKSIGPQSTFPLSGTPETGTLSVSINGSAQTSGWTYDAATNSVVFTSAPPAGDTVTVTYTKVCGP